MQKSKCCLAATAVPLPAAIRTDVALVAGVGWPAAALTRGRVTATTQRPEDRAEAGLATTSLRRPSPEALPTSSVLYVLGVFCVLGILSVLGVLGVLGVLLTGRRRTVSNVAETD